MGAFRTEENVLYAFLAAFVLGSTYLVVVAAPYLCFASIFFVLAWMILLPLQFFLLVSQTVVSTYSFLPNGFVTLKPVSLLFFAHFLLSKSNSEISTSENH